MVLSLLGTSVRRFGDRIERVSQRWMPTPFLFALILTYVVFIAGLVVQGDTPIAMLQYWNAGFWSLLRFGMQMTFILTTGYVLIHHHTVQRGIAWLAHLPSNGKQATVLVGVVAMVTAWFHWGLGLVVGAVFARDMGEHAQKQGLSVHYPLLCVAGYMGMGLTWHLGLSGSVPVLMNTPENVFVGLGLVEGVIPPSETIFAPSTLLLVVLGIAYTTGVLYLMAPAPADAVGISEYLPEGRASVGDAALADGGERDTDPADSEPDDWEWAAPGDDQPADSTASSEGASNVDATTDARRVPADWIDQNRVLGVLIAAGGVLVTGYVFLTRGLGGLTFNVINFALLFIGLGLYMSPLSYQDEFYNAVSAAAGIILQFPFYAGIVGMMNESGLSRRIADGLMGIATEATVPLVTAVTAGVVNLFVPSGGAEWTAVGDEALRAAAALGVSAERVIVAFSLGDAVGNLLQPFWAIPVIGITGVRARDLFGYAIAMLLLLSPFLGLVLMILPY